MKKSRQFAEGKGNFISIPNAFKEATGSLKNVFKFEAETIQTGSTKIPLGLNHAIYTDGVFVDLEAYDSTDIKTNNLINDCKILEEIINNNPAEIKEMLKAYQSGPDGFKKVSKIAGKIGLTEINIAKKGGGFLGLVILLVVVVASSGCAHCGPYVKKDKRQ